MVKAIDNIKAWAKENVQLITILPKNENLQVKTRLKDVLETSVDEKYYLSDEKTALLVAKLEEKDKVVGTVGHHPFSKKFEFSGYNSEVSPTLLATDYKAPKTVLEEGLLIREATKQGYALAVEGDAVNFQFPNSQTRRGRVGKQIANTLEASGVNQGVVEESFILDTKPKDAFRVYKDLCPTLQANDYKEPKKVVEEVPLQQYSDGEGISYNLDANYAKGTSVGDVGKGRRTQIVEGIAPSYRIRKLTPLECFRLQSFPDWAYHEATEVNSNSQLYKQAGNSVTVNVIREIAKRLN